METEKLCFNCMEKQEGRYCGKCGFDNEGYEPPTHHIKPGTVLNNRYYIGKAIGEGGFGITYVGFDINLEIKTAIKEYFPKGCASRNAENSNSIVPNEDKTEKFEAGKEKFISEARILAQLDNVSGVVSVKDFFQENDTAYIVMEFVEGQTLKEYLKNRGGRIAADEAVELLKPIIKAMAQVHRVGIIHRDISPENIMITPSGSAKLIDFGSVRLSEDEYKSSAVQLKPGYAPPEQYSSDGDQGAWTDVYALCATLYRAVTGTTPTASIERMKGAALKTLSEAGADILPIRDRAIMVGLELDHNKRFNNMDALGNALSVEAPYERQINNTDASSVNGTAASSADDDSKGYINDITTKQVHNNTVAKGALSPVFIAIIAALSVLIIALIALIAVFAIKGNSTTRKNNTSESLVYTESVTPAPTPAPTAIPAPEFEHVSGSSTRGSDTSSGKEINYYIDYIRDGDYTTAWSSDRNIELTPTVIFSSETKQHVTGIRIANGYFKSEETYRKNRRITKILITHDGGSQEASLNTDSYRVMQDIRLNTPVDTSFVSIKVLESLSGEWKDIAISEISIY